MGLALILNSCSSTRGEVKLIPVDTVKIDKRYGVFDLNYYVEEMVQYMRAHKLFDIPNPVIEVGSIIIDSSVDEPIDPRTIQEKIKIDLIKSELAIFIEPERVDKKYPNHIKAQYELRGRLSAIKKNLYKGIDYYYILSMMLVNNDTGKNAWANAVEIRKGE